MQREMGFFAKMRHPVMVPKHYIDMCKSSGAAVLLAIREGGKQVCDVAESIEMGHPQLSRIVTGSHHFPADKALELAYATGNHAWLQWVAASCGFDLVPRVESIEERMYRLEAENAELRARNAA